MADNADKPLMDINAVMAQLPHRYPFLLIDRVLEMSDDHLLALKQVTINEPYFNGHFPQRPIMPGVLIIEALAQATGLLAFQTLGAPQGNTLYYICGIDNARFKRPVEPGDSLRLHVKLIRKVKTVWRFEATATVDGRTAARAEIMAARVEVDS